MLKFPLVKKGFVFSILAVLPVCLLYSSFSIFEVAGPYWFGMNFDPSQAYLSFSLSIATGNFKDIKHLYHPGMPQQWLGAASLHLTHILTGEGNSLQRDVFLHSDFYIRCINLHILIVASALLFISGYLAFLFTNNVLLAILVQFTPFFSIQTIGNIFKFSSEPFLMIPVLGLIIVTLILLRRAAGGIGSVFIYAYAFFAAIGITTKANFYPLAILPFLFLPAFKNKIKYSIAVVIFCLILTFPIWHSYQPLSKLYWSIFVHNGYLGAGEANIINWRKVPDNLQFIFKAETVYCLLLTACVVFVLFHLAFSRSRREVWKNAYFKAASYLSLIQLILMVMVIKHVHPRFLVPGQMLIGFNLFLIFYYCFLKFADNKFILRLISAAIVILILFSGWSEYRHFIQSRRYIFRQTNEYYRICRIINQPRYAEYAKIFSFGGPSLEYSLFRADFRFASSRNHKLLKQLYPYCYIYDYNYFVVSRKPGLHLEKGFKMRDLIKRHNNLFILSRFKMKENSLKVENENLAIPLKDLALGKTATVYVPNIR